MKKLSLFIFMFFICASVFAQSPQAISYQALVRNADGDPVSNASVGVQISILQGSAAGTAIYVERHFPPTNANGLFSLEIGDGVVVSGDFAMIDWSNGSYFLKTETDPLGGAAYTISGTTQLLSVPYALHANESNHAASADIATNATNAENAENATYADTSGYALNGSLWENFGGNIYYWDGFVGVGIQPIAPFSVKGSTGFASSNDEAYSLLVDDTGNLSFHANNMLGTGTPTLTLDDSNFKRVGFGIATPEEKLHVVGGGVRIDETTSDPNPNTAYGNALPIAYGYFAGTTISQDYGVTSITNPTTGNYIVTLDNDFSGAPVVMATSFNAVPGAEVVTYSYTAPNIINVHVADGTGTAKNSNFSIVVFGVAAQ